MSFFRILIFAALAMLAYSLLRKATLAMRGGSPTESDSRLGRLEPCAQCGVYVDSDEAVRHRLNGEKRLFCSDRCVQDAEAAAREDAESSGPGSP